MPGTVAVLKAKINFKYTLFKIIFIATPGKTLFALTSCNRLPFEKDNLLKKYYVKYFFDEFCN